MVKKVASLQIQCQRVKSKSCYQQNNNSLPTPTKHINMNHDKANDNDTNNSDIPPNKWESVDQHVTHHEENILVEIGVGVNDLVHLTPSAVQQVVEGIHQQGTYTIYPIYLKYIEV